FRPQQIEAGSPTVQAIPSTRVVGGGICRYGHGGGVYSDRQGWDSFAVRAGVGAGRPDFHVLWPWYGGNVPIRHAQLDSPLGWPSRPMVSLGHHRVRLHWTSIFVTA